MSQTDQEYGTGVANGAGVFPRDPAAPPANSKLMEELCAVLNRNCVENASHTPDYLLASYLGACLDAYAAAVTARDHWFGFKPWGHEELRPGGITRVDLVQQRASDDGMPEPPRVDER